MGRSKKALPLIESVEIVDAAAEGMAVARVDGMVVFVPFVVPGDMVDIQIVKKKHHYAEGRAVKFHRLSKNRVEAQCPHFGSCGGCKWQTMDYAMQLRYKQQQVRDNLERLGNVDCSGMRTIRGADMIFNYRNKMEYTFSSRRWRTLEEIAMGNDTDGWGALGFHAPGLFDKVLDIEYCALQASIGNEVRSFVREYAIAHGLDTYDIRNHKGFLRNLIIRNSSTGGLMVIVVVAMDDHERIAPLLEALHSKFSEISSLQYIINDKMNDSYGDLNVYTYFGADHIEEQMEGYDGAKPLHFIVNPKSFYQTNSQQAQRLYSYVAEFADLHVDDTLYDLYTGTGTIAIFLAHLCKHVVGIEYVEEAIEDAKHNAILNGYSHCRFFAGDMAQVLTQDFVNQNGKPDVIVVDPPRAGMHEKVVHQLIATAPRKIVYVSCNPATQARDLHLLSEKYAIGRIQPVDMFPHTQHVENVVELVLK